MSETYTTDSAEALAEAIHNAVCPPSGFECSWLNDENGDPSCLPEYTRPLAQALIASGAVRREAEVRAEAWRASRLDLAHELRESGAWSEVRMAEWVEMRADRGALAEEGDIWEEGARKAQRSDWEREQIERAKDDR